jgi:hypothetical protein
MTSSLASFSRHRFTTVSILALCVATTAGCDTSGSNTDPRPHCPPDAGTICGGPTGGGSNTSGGSSSGSGSGGQGGSAATNDVTGNVGVLSDLGFSQVSPYIGAATIVTTAKSGAPLEAPYGEMTTSFSFLSVKTGPTWFFVKDDTAGATGIFSTHSVVSVPVNGPVTLPVVDSNVLTSIAGSLPTPVVIDGSRGVLVIKVVRNGQPLAGVSLTTPPAGAELVYDTGVGLYSNQVLQTGPAGVIMALNVDGPSTAQLMDLTLTDINQQSYFVQIRIQAAAATFAGYEL